MKNPYSVKDGSIRRINLPVSQTDYDLFRSVCTEQRDTTSCVAILFHAVVERIRRERWVYTDRARLVDLVERTAASLVETSGPDKDVRRRNKSLSSRSAGGGDNEAHQPSA